jgi:RNA polymerase sigma factor (TIGR02999 family)
LGSRRPIHARNWQEPALPEDDEVKNDDRKDMTDLLKRAASGDASAGDEVFAEIYDELKRLASIQRGRASKGETLVTTAIVHEAYLRLVGRGDVDWNDRNHFFCSAARAMRDVVVDEARRKRSRKRGGDQRRVELTEVAGSASTPEDLLDLDDALSRLEREIPEDAQIVLLRYFTGLSLPETAQVLGRSLRTVERRWQFCRAWLAKELQK